MILFSGFGGSEGAGSSKSRCRGHGLWDWLTVFGSILGVIKGQVAEHSEGANPFRVEESGDI